MFRILAIASVIILIIGVGLYFYLGVTPAPVAQTPTDPFAPSPSTPQSPSTPVTGTSITLTDGTQASLPNYSLREYPEWVKPVYGYPIAGHDNGPFQVLYFPQEQRFLISIFVEPIGQVRLNAEAALKESTGLTEHDLCLTHTEVVLLNQVNETYEGRNLGLSFCANAIALP